MSKEREMIEKLCSFQMTYSDWLLLIADAEELLAQPEQEPVAWMYDHQLEVGYDKYTEVNIIETCARNLESNNCINIRPLYLAPPKREPLINIYVLNAFKADDEATHPYSYWAGVEFAEKHHGIGVDDEH